jgi:glucose-6-phosphate-specific signal transduction histidine kinase
LTAYLTNAQLLKHQLQEASLFGALTSVLKDTHLSMEQLLKRLNPDSIDDLMAALQNQGQDLAEVQRRLADPIVMLDDNEEEEEDEEEIVLPNVPTHSALPTEATATTVPILLE